MPASANRRSRRAASPTLACAHQLVDARIKELLIAAGPQRGTPQVPPTLLFGEFDELLGAIVLAPAADGVLEFGAHIRHDVASAPLQKLEHGRAALDAVAFKVTVF